MDSTALASYIIKFLRERNAAELESAFGEMKMSSFELLLSELELILRHRGKPPNWT